ncbi:MAG: SprT family zinc-dependent metalloprotease [Actinomycetota bacterium]|nr:SprT family zinc-dependent metalloprotease [Actinomycetota bacterium]
MNADAVLPAYAIRRSDRARRIRLTVSARDGLVDTLPRGVTDDEARRVVGERAAWAHHHLAATAQRRAELRAEPAEQLPDAVALAAFGETWPVVLRPRPSLTVRARHAGGSLVLTGPIHDAEECLRSLRRWRDRTARERLPHLLADVSREVGIEYARVTVRGQKTRWGSCSSRATISLNRNLVFLPEHIVRYVMAHELAHIREPNHSARFWALLEHIAPGVRDARNALRGASHHVPAWADPGASR